MTGLFGAPTSCLHKGRRTRTVSCVPAKTAAAASAISVTTIYVPSGANTAGLAFWPGGLAPGAKSTLALVGPGSQRRVLPVGEPAFGVAVGRPVEDRMAHERGLGITSRPGERQVGGEPANAAGRRREAARRAGQRARGAWPRR